MLNAVRPGMTDFAKFREFVEKMEWEGGFEDMANYGWDEDLGDDELNKYWHNFKAALEVLSRRYDKLNRQLRQTEG